jgi:hypothetical protein
MYSAVILIYFISDTRGNDLLVVYPVPTNEAMTTESQRYNSSGMEEMSSQNTPVQRLRVATLPQD